MFTQSCYINKNSRNLRDMLGRIGYKPRGKNKDFSHIYCHRGIYSTPSTNEKPPKDYYIGCGTNEELFLAIAALRDDTDKNQWFVYDNSEWANDDEKARVFLLCNEDKIETFACIDLMYKDCHKATVEELIEHFKDKQLCTE